MINNLLGWIVAAVEGLIIIFLLVLYVAIGAISSRLEFIAWGNEFKVHRNDVIQAVQAINQRLIVLEKAQEGEKKP